jgi:hypothetical protein
MYTESQERNNMVEHKEFGDRWWLGGTVRRGFVAYVAKRGLEPHIGM